MLYEPSKTQKNAFVILMVIIALGVVLLGVFLLIKSDKSLFTESLDGETDVYNTIEDSNKVPIGIYKQQEVAPESIFTKEPIVVTAPSNMVDEDLVKLLTLYKQEVEMYKAQSDNLKLQLEGLLARSKMDSLYFFKLQTALKNLEGNIIEANLALEQFKF